MKLEKELKDYKAQVLVALSEEKILETIKKSQEVFISSEQERSTNYFEFMFEQFRMIRKKWWLLQTLLLVVASIALPYMQNKVEMLRVLGVVGVLFIVLIIPELWKNKYYDCMQIEGACFYSLRQIYTVRIIIFGMVDMFLLTSFCVLANEHLGLMATEILIQFLFPILVSACICFGTLCNNHFVNDNIAIVACLLWSVIWCMVIMNEAIYSAITFPIWCSLFGIFSIFLVGVVYKTIYDCNRFWEVNLSGITNS